jgi:hypothetical protein
MKRHRKLSEQMEKNIQEIVDFYMQFVTQYQEPVKDYYEYYWRCMSDGSIEDHLQTVRKRKASKK